LSRENRVEAVSSLAPLYLAHDRNSGRSEDSAVTSTNDIWIPIAISFLLSLLLTPLARRFGHGLRLIDVPNERSSHAVPTPRTGGIAILLGIIGSVAVAGFLASKPGSVLLLGALTLGALSLYDDRRTLPRHFRLFVQTIVAVVVLSATNFALRTIELPLIGPLELGVFAIPIAIFWIVAVTNAFNFMDGINGMASLEAVICSATLGFQLASGGDLPGAVLAGAIAGAAAGFLPWNLSGSIFMGDVGSAALGFLLSLLVLRAGRVVPAVAAMLPLAPFLFDAGVTIVARAVRGERFFSTPHRSHFYQKLVDSGLSHITVSLIYALLAGVSSTLALLYTRLSDAQRIFGVLLVILIHVMVAASTLRLQPRRKVSPV
jgi:UDP-N-acetylmuramyl pentapeptide phosphotransferase/UDP-N-acetylglucosamine-1-phosphate transferase